MTPLRLIVWPALLACYAAVPVACAGWLANRLTGPQFVWLAGVVVVGVPALVGYGGAVWVRRPLRGVARVEVLACFTLPVVLLMLSACVILIGPL